MNSIFVTFLEALNDIDPIIIGATKAAYIACFESPISYDDESHSKHGKMDKISKSTWGKYPPDDISVDDLKIWIENSINAGILSKSSTESAGSSRIVVMNDHKTVLKYNYSSSDNQIHKEIKSYINHYDRFKDILPVIYAYGENWMVEEYIKPIDESSFHKLTNITSRELQYAIMSINNELMYKSLNDIISEDPNIYVSKLSNCKLLMRIIEFAVLCNLDLFEIRIDNLGDKNGSLKVIDWGF